jgi:hypothetical protein
MAGLGIGMAPREFDCIFCQQHFTLLCGDLIVTEYLICDECLAELQQLEEDELRKHVSQHLAESAPRRDQEFENEIVRAIQRIKQHGTRDMGKSIQEMLSK